MYRPSNGTQSTLRVGQSLNITGNDRSINVLVEEVLGESHSRGAELLITSPEGSSTHIINPSDGIIKVLADLELRTTNTNRDRGKQVSLVCYVPDDYSVKRYKREE